MGNSALILVGDAIKCLQQIPHESVHCVVTSPPYWGLRDYGVKGQIGLEKSPQQYIERIVAVFREVRRVLRSDGTLWLNMGDSYSNAKNVIGMPWRLAFALQADGWFLRQDIIWSKPNAMPESVRDRCTKSHEYIFLLSKSRKYYYDAEAIREQVTGNAHPRGEGVNPKATVHGQHSRMQEDRDPRHTKPRPKQNESFSAAISRHDELVTSRNKRSVWEVSTQPFPDAHFATFPEELIKPCILAGTSEKGACARCRTPWERVMAKRATGEMYPSSKAWDDSDGSHGSLHRNGRGNKMPDSSVTVAVTLLWRPRCKCESDPPPMPSVVLDPFCGAATTGVVVLRHQRSFIGIELKPAYARMGADRIFNDQPLFNHVKIERTRGKR